MALIPCQECSKEISHKAPTCPHCGCPHQLPEELAILVNCDSKECQENNGIIKITINASFCPVCENEQTTQFSEKNEKGELVPAGHWRERRDMDPFWSNSVAENCVNFSVYVRSRTPPSSVEVVEHNAWKRKFGGTSKKHRRTRYERGTYYIDNLEKEHGIKHGLSERFDWDGELTELTRYNHGKKEWRRSYNSLSGGWFDQYYDDDEGKSWRTHYDSQGRITKEQSWKDILGDEIESSVELENFQDDWYDPDTGQRRLMDTVEHGEWKEYWYDPDTGQQRLRELRTYEEGVLHGPYENHDTTIRLGYDSDGIEFTKSSSYEIGHYRNGRKYGEWERGEWTEEGQQEEEKGKKTSGGTVLIIVILVFILGMLLGGQVIP